MSRLGEVIKNKNKLEKASRNRRKREIARLRAQTAFKARLYDELKHVDILLDDDNIKAVIITVPEAMQSSFGTALYSEDLVDYEITQVEGTADKFYVRKKFIAF
mgnify:CR=1 FL=1